MNQNKTNKKGLTASKIESFLTEDVGEEFRRKYDSAQYAIWCADEDFWIEAEAKAAENPDYRDDQSEESNKLLYEAALTIAKEQEE